MNQVRKRIEGFVSMLPDFILPESTVREAGNSKSLDLGESKGGLVLLTLGITRIIEQQSLDMSVWGSPDGADWGSKALASFPQKFYCGTYQILLDMSKHPEIKHIRVKWAVNRWGKGDSKPLFGVYVFAQEMQQKVLAMGA